jgi:tetratricopeptide (TPR) repeat protein
MATETLSLDSLFCSAIEMASAEERAAYIARACGNDSELRQRVEKLVAAHFRAGRFLEEPAGDLGVTGEYTPSPAECHAGTVALTPEGPGTVIGRYELLEQMGEGGFGLVFMAEQTHPVCRKVALKVLKPGMDSRQVIARFEAERQALAMMDHANIAHVFDAGTTESGRPYFVMELVKGIPITDYCDQEQLTPRERLGLFVQVCSAVQHAHQKGIIHRDIKPSNVLVTLHDGVPVPKVIDFGIAKALSGRLTDRPLFTGFAQMIGTPLYMSPEQAALSGLDVDTRSDVYSLGVLLYELLTGTTPFGAERLREVGHDEMRRIIREEEPPRPSARISTLGQVASTVSIKRRTDPRRLSLLCRGELDWIVMKALEKDRRRRYESASAVAADVQRYLDDEPVTACPPSASYRLKKLARQYKAAIVTAGLVAAALLAGTAVSLWQAIEASRARREAEANFLMARKAVHDALEQLAEEPRLKEAELQDLRKSLLTRVLPFYEEFVKQRSDDPKLEADRGQVFRQLGALHQELRDHQAAMADAESALEIFTRLSKAHPEEPSYRHLLAKGFIDKGSLLDEMGKQTEALAQFQAAREDLEPLTEQFPEMPAYRKTLAIAHHNLGVVLEKQSRRAEAEVEQRNVVKVLQALVAEVPDSADYRSQLAANRDRLAHLLAAGGLVSEAEKEYRAGLELREKLAAEFPRRLDYRGAPGASRQNLAALYQSMGDRTRAEAEYRAIVDGHKGLIAEFPHVHGLRSGLSDVHANLTTLLLQQGKFDEAAEQYRAFAPFWELQVAQYPHLPEYRQRLLHAHQGLGRARLGQGQFPEAASEFVAARKVGQALVELFPCQPEYQQDLAACHTGLADAYRKMERPEEARAEIQAGLQLRETLVREKPGVLQYRNALAASHDSLGVLLWQTGKLPEAEAELERALHLYQALAAELPRVPSYRQHLAQIHVKRGLVAGEQGKRSEKTAELRRAQEILDQLARDFPNSPDILVDRGGNLCNLGNNLREDQQPASALRRYAQAIQTLESALHKEPRHHQGRKFLANAHAGRALALAQLERVAESLQDADRALELVEPVRRSAVLIMRASCLARPAPERAAVEVEQVLKGEKDGAVFYNAACFYSQVSGRENVKEKAGRYATRAVELLQQAQAAGYFQATARVAWMKRDSDLDPIRNREDYRQLLKRVEEKEK